MKFFHVYTISNENGKKLDDRELAKPPILKDRSTISPTDPSRRLEIQMTWLLGSNPKYLGNHM